MNPFITLTARDGHELQAYTAAPSSAARGGLVVLQEIFGVNRHLRAVTDRLAAEGYRCVAPSLFDRIGRGIRLEHTPHAIEEGIGYAMRLESQHVLADMAAAVASLEDCGRVGVVGYCLGGQFAYVAACELLVVCAVSYYGGNLPSLLAKKPRCPVMYHFGERDKYIPLSDIEQVRRAHPEGTVYLYPAEHGFASDDRPEYDAECAAVAQRRTLAFLARHIATAGNGPID